MKLGFDWPSDVKEEYVKTLQRYTCIYSLGAGADKPKGPKWF